MTKDEILNMQAGREMDALIAERVMGIDLTKKCDGGMYDEDGQNWSCTACGKWGDWGEDFKHTIVPRRYSKSILWAWEVVEKLDNPSISLITAFGLWTCEGRGDTFYKAEAITAPLAICRAALLAVENND